MKQKIIINGEEHEITLTPEQIKEIKDKIKEENEYPKNGDSFWVNSIFGFPEEYIWNNNDLRHMKMKSQGIYRTKKEAEKEALRREARAKRFEFIPKEEEEFFWYRFTERCVRSDYWDKDMFDYASWNMGNCHRTEEEAWEWGKKYADCFLPPKPTK